ncbi:cell division protein FtsI [Luteococcus sanguinis]
MMANPSDPSRKSTRGTGRSASGASRTPAQHTNSQRTSSPRTSSQRTSSQRPRPATSKRPIADGLGASAGRAASSVGNARLALASPRRRLNILLVLVALVLSGFVVRAFQLQAFDSQAYASKAAKQMTRTATLIAQRGTITDRNGVVMAASEPAVKIIADPSMIARNGVDKRRDLTTSETAIASQNAVAIAEALAKYLGGKSTDYLPKLSEKSTNGSLKQYVVIQRHVPAATYQLLQAELAKGGKVTVDGKEYKAPYWYGLYKEDDPVRQYPGGSVGGNLIGTINDEQKATGGVELSLTDMLKGTNGSESYEASAYGRIPLGSQVLTPAVDGDNVTLTLDSEMQQIAEAALAKGIEGSAAKTGTAIVMNVKTGEVLADASLPSYDPTDMTKVKAENLGNRSVTTPYEPGSVQKVLTMAMLADKAGITADSRVVVEDKYASGDGYIRDSFSHDRLYLTARGIIAKSSNIGMATLISDAVDKRKVMTEQDIVDYLKSFGLGARTGIQLPGESAGVLPTADMPQYTRDQIAFGQGLSVTAVQEAAAVAAIANDGVYNAPTLVKAATDGTGATVDLPATASHRVVSVAAAEQVQDMMEAVIQLNPEQRAIDGYRTIGKSGTAERANNSGGYTGYTASFALAAPAEDPQILVYVVIDQPEKSHQGSEIALPVANSIMKLALPRYGVLPSTTEAADEPLDYEP